MLRIALTGGIASGKSTVCRLFAAYGVPIVDADFIARELVEPHQAGWNQLLESFGSSILNPDNSLNRAWLRQQIFSAPEQRKKLDAIMHPMIYSAIDTRMTDLKTSYGLAAIPLLVETGKQDCFDRVLVVDCPEDTQLQRLLTRDNTDIIQAKAMIASQASRNQRLAIANDIIDNAYDESQLAEQVKSLHNLYLNLAITRKSPA